MAVSKVSISEAKLCCAICLDLLKSPATIPCGHNFCMECIGRCWHQDGRSETFRCPQCRETFNSRPSLSKNTILCEIVEDFTNSDSSSTSKDATGPQDVLCDFCTEQKLEAVKSCVVCMASFCQLHLLPHASNPVFKDHRIISPIRDIESRKCPSHRKPLEVFCRTDQTSVCCLCAINEHRQHETVSLEEQVSELKKELNERQGEVDTLIEETSGEIGKLKQKIDSIKEYQQLNKPVEACPLLPCQVDAKFSAVECALTELSNHITQQLHGSFNPHLDLERAKGYVPALSVPPGNQQMPRVPSPRTTGHEDHDVSNSINPSDTCLMETKPDPTCKKRADYLHHALHLMFDPNTAHKHLLLSDDNRTVTDVDPECVSYPEHQDRFNSFPQVLCTQSISEGCCYWEVEVSGHWAGIGLTYQGIKRKGSNMSSLIGRNNLSWCLLYSNSKFSALHNKQEVTVQSGRQQRIGIYLDYSEGTLEFYGVGNTMSLIHRFKAVFTEPVYPAFFVFLGTSLSLCQLS
ncbi:E3 ubiquitin/ISG15 ligase TRIM25-like isoform X3 [Mobula hypostoma]|uniref:E3 ubiquitin/ISG15 ligase TRIM25-like isoform X3 n=1 Tax=Mobula hypostoma TaxID=723540 RepID=UPI002FC276F2